MQYLTNPESEIFNLTLKKQIPYINSRLRSIKSRYLEDKMFCLGEKEDIAKHLNQGPAANLVQTFFNFKANKCLLYKGKIGENGINKYKEHIVTSIRDMIY